MARDPLPDQPSWGIDHPFARDLVRATEEAARAAANWLKNGEAFDLSRSARIAMKRALDDASFSAEIVIGDGPGDSAHKLPLSLGKRVGPGDHGLDKGGAFDLALDPTEGASYLVRGQTNALAIAALAPEGTLLRPGPAFYMAKIVTSKEVIGRIDPGAPVPETLGVIAKSLGKSVCDLTVFVLEKPRHRGLIEDIEHAGARVALFPAGDIAGVAMAAIPDSGIDAMIGTGGSSEGVISAAIVRALGGVFLGRFNPQLSTEHIAVRQAGIDTNQWMEIDEIVTNDDTIVAATGITSGILLDGVTDIMGAQAASSMIFAGCSGERVYQTTYRPYGQGQEYIDALEASSDAVE